MNKILDICSICYNEELLLPRWAELWLSIPCVNKINLIDAGSTDRTVEIARSYGINVIVVPWAGSFSKQRNIAIKLARSEWLVQPDIDEIPCGNILDNDFYKFLCRQNINQIALPYIKFYDWNKLWFFKDGNTPRLKGDLVQMGFKSTITVFKKGHLKGYSKDLHEMPIFNGEEKRLNLSYSHYLSRLKEEFLIGHVDQAKHFEQARQNGTTVEYEMGLKRARYRLISDVVYDGRLYDKQWAEKALKENNKEMLEELGAAQLKEFLNQHETLEGFDATELLN
jgi:glycosyltransferase involved in cell wall biosynthesis